MEIVRIGLCEYLHNFWVGKIYFGLTTKVSDSVEKDKSFFDEMLFRLIQKEQ